ncbi:hypothetical protein [Streptomyces sp. 2314.4]|uniref:hypothetical protein n=1 Tax=Streptomyces sp. 2314.4 TaxID=1881025 RepID=UPI00089BFDF3|nr:hypothetical protein [Streptomyces sp. 2314.4]SEC15389.1 hypothetical protein SAMN05428943_1137 [Streptomyces sp. 2314.4]
MAHHPACPDCLRAAHADGHPPPADPEPDEPIPPTAFLYLFLILVVLVGGWFGFMWLVAKDVGWP